MVRRLYAANWRGKLAATKTKLTHYPFFSNLASLRPGNILSQVNLVSVSHFKPGRPIHHAPESEKREPHPEAGSLWPSRSARFLLRFSAFQLTFQRMFARLLLLMPSIAERPIAVFKVSPVIIVLSIFLAVLLQISLPVKMPVARLFDLPLLLTIYFTLLRRNKIFGTLLGMAIGLLQDAFSHGLIGMFGMSKSLVGYLAAWASVRFDTERMTSRIFLTAVLIACHSLEITGLQHVLMEYSPPFVPLDLASTVLTNSALALILFQVLDRFKRPA